MDLANQRKIVFLGDPNVGKSTIIQRFLTNHLPPNPKATVGALEHHHTLYLNKSAVDLKLEIWDIAGGQAPMESFTAMYYRDADACIMVFDMTERSSFENITTVWNHALEQKGPKQLVKVIVGNKSEDDEQIQVKQEEIEKVATELGAIHFIVSAKKNRGLNDVFQKVGEKLI